MLPIWDLLDIVFRLLLLCGSTYTPVRMLFDGILLFKSITLHKRDANVARA
jgi:hypothetical protein